MTYGILMLYEMKCSCILPGFVPRNPLVSLQMSPTVVFPKQHRRCECEIILLTTTNVLAAFTNWLITVKMQSKIRLAAVLQIRWGSSCSSPRASPPLGALRAPNGGKGMVLERETKRAEQKGKEDSIHASCCKKTASYTETTRDYWAACNLFKFLRGLDPRTGGIISSSPSPSPLELQSACTTVRMLQYSTAEGFLQCGVIRVSATALMTSDFHDAMRRNAH